MSNTHNNPQEHKLLKLNILGNITALLSSNGDYLASIENLAATCALPLPYTRQILVHLLRNPIIGPHLTSAELTDTESGNAEPADAKLTDAELANLNLNMIQEKIQGGEYDSIAWHLDLSDYMEADQELLSLSGMEYNSFKKMINKKQSVYKIKSVAPEMSKHVKQLLEKIRILTEQEKEIYFQYRTNAKKIEHIHCKPEKLFTNTTDNLVYLRASDGGTFLLDNIRECGESAKTGDCLKNRHQGDNLPEDSPDNSHPGENRSEDNYPEAEPQYHKYLWGPSPRNGETPERVKLRISKYATDGRLLGNIPRKIRNDLHFREETCRITEDERYIYYEDIILGMNNFKRWMRGYGSSIEVIEPQHVRDEILESACKTLGFYERVEEWTGL